jgi:hypothetical protein
VRRLLVAFGWTAVAVVALLWLFVASAALTGLIAGFARALL